MNEVTPDKSIDRFYGGAFHDTLETGKATGDILISSFDISFEKDGVKLFSLQKGNYTLERGGAGNKLIFFKSPDNSLTLYTSDPALKKSNYLIDHPELKKLTTKIKHSNILSVSFLLCIIILVILLPFSIFKGSYPLTKKVAAIIPASLEKKIGDSVFAQLSLKYTPLSNIEISENLNKISKFLFQNTSYKIPLITIHETTEANALALPGERIILFKGLFDHLNSVDELMAVIAHESGHINLKHGIRSLIQTAGYFIIIRSFFGDLSGLFAVLIDNSSFLARMTYSRIMETEADDFAVKLLLKNNINPGSLADFLTNLKGNKKERKLLGYLSTHPLTDDRISNISITATNEKKHEYKQASEKTREAFENLKILLTSNNEEKEEDYENHP